MKRFLVPVAAAAAAIVLAAPVQGATPHRWSKMTLKEQKAHIIRTIHHDRTAVTWWLTHRPRGYVRSLQTFTGAVRGCPALGGVLAPVAVCIHARHLPIAEAKLAEVNRAIAAADARAQAAKLAAALPAHNWLWECLLPHEGGYPSNQNTGGNGHWGGLQMHPGWGYGTSYHASDDPWIVQKQSAERGYAASGYSSAWLWGQWGQTLGNCV